MVFFMEIVQNILNMAKEKKITNQQLCKILETNPNKIYDWKIGKSKPSAEDVSKLADYFGCSVDYLLGRENTSDTTVLPAKLQELVDTASSLSEEQLSDLLRYVRFIKADDEK